VRHKRRSGGIVKEDRLVRWSLIEEQRITFLFVTIQDELVFRTRRLEAALFDRFERLRKVSVRAMEAARNRVRVEPEVSQQAPIRTWSNAMEGWRRGEEEEQKLE
jgi:diaminopimelate decarboxylase